MSSIADSDTKLRVGILGAGMIATVSYGVLPNMEALLDRVEVTAIASRDFDRAEAVARTFGIPKVYPDLTTMVADADIDAVVNLTPIPAHYRTSIEILEAGKHLVTEKPIATTMAEADEICDLAERKELVVVCSPAEMLADEWVLARHLVIDGAIGKVAFARVLSSHGGPANLFWPADPSWFYQKGAGPLLDMGVYGIHRVTGVLGPAKRVVAFSGITAPTRRVRGGPFDGMNIPVTEDDNTLLMLDFGDSTFAVVDCTYNVVATKSPEMELFGLEGTVIVNRACAEAPSVEIFRFDAAPGVPGWIKPSHIGNPHAQDRTRQLQRAVLVDHLADCITNGTPPILSAAHARHALEIMLAAYQSAREGIAIELETTF